MSKRTGDEASTTKSPKRPKGEAKSDDAVVNKFRWNLTELPSSQHRAGLAGLALSVELLKRKRDREGVCEIEAIDEDGLTLAVDRRGMQSLFDDLYAATHEQSLVKKKWAGDEPEGEVEVEVTDEKTGETKREKRFVYKRVAPAGVLLDELEQQHDGTKPWLKLWRDVLWATLHNRARGQYESRANGLAVDDGGKAWDAIRKAPFKAVALSGTFALGAEAANDDAVAITDSESNRLLLRFWRLVAVPYVVRIATRKEPDGTIKSPQYYAIAVPDVADLAGFVAAWPNIIAQRSGQRYLFRPRDSIVDVASEAGLDAARRANAVVAVGQGAAARGLFRAVDVLHVVEGVVSAQSRVDIVRTMVDEYARVRAVAYRSPIFRRRRVENVLDCSAWWVGFARLCSLTPHEMTIGHREFRHDCRQAFKETEMKEDTAEADQTLEHLIYRRVQAYVLGKTDRKYDLSWQKAQGNAGDEKEYRDKREKVAREAFLAVRSRTGADFVAYFTSTLCSVPQHTSEAKYLEIARALMDPASIERVRSLTLLALSAVA